MCVYLHILAVWFFIFSLLIYWVRNTKTPLKESTGLSRFIIYFYGYFSNTCVSGWTGLVTISLEKYCAPNNEYSQEFGTFSGIT
jgi:hypothetical protein